jgi:hypothetical protein
LKQLSMSRQTRSNTPPTVSAAEGAFGRHVTYAVSARKPEPSSGRCYVPVVRR